MKKYYDYKAVNYLIPCDEFIHYYAEVLNFLMHNTEYSLNFLAKDDGYPEDMWCIDTLYK